MVFCTHLISIRFAPFYPPCSPQKMANDDAGALSWRVMIMLCKWRFWLWTLLMATKQRAKTCPEGRKSCFVVCSLGTIPKRVSFVRRDSPVFDPFENLNGFELEVEQWRRYSRCWPGKGQQFQVADAKSAKVKLSYFQLSFEDLRTDFIYFVKKKQLLLMMLYN